ncbi:hypothetical protein M432DRAFT_666902 [Thermoascus aurantiacus ATCC 26904]
MALNSPFPISPAATVLSTGFLGLGALHILAPLQMCELFGLPCSSIRAPGTPTTTAKQAQPEPEPAPLAFIYANGGRELMLSIAFLIMGMQGNREGMRALMYGISVAAQIDAYVVWKYGGSKYGGWKGRWPMHSLGGILVGLAAWKGWFL